MTEFVKIQGKGGHEYLVLAEKDFDPKVHKLFVAKGRAKPKDDDEDDASDGIVSVNVEKAIALVEAAETVEALDVLEAAEKAHPKSEGGRKGVLAAIEGRREALKG